MSQRKAQSGERDEIDDPWWVVPSSEGAWLNEQVRLVVREEGFGD